MVFGKKTPFPISRFGLFLLTAVVGAGVDLWSKSVAFRQMGMPGEKPPYWVIPDVFGVQTSLNEGALFGLGQGFTLWFCVISLMAFLFIGGWLFVWGNARYKSWTFLLGLICGGIFGNLYDRLGWPGLFWNYSTPLHEVGEPVYAVRDWILVMIGTYHWPNFNIADSLLVVGAVGIMFLSLWQKEEDGKEES
ncbi:MAG: signal peptidase II [Planctomycetia bacterium]|nr:signal peptidase II [Planctomycetia bacterium]